MAATKVARNPDVGEASRYRALDGANEEIPPFGIICRQIADCAAHEAAGAADDGAKDLACIAQPVQVESRLLKCEQLLLAPAIIV
ncbi:hypothetical protein A4A58_15350 [Tardiphaga robiniae]|uniref:Uncharacterized protein n=1 Tax=Tardiphaga robiniae TaxID=943830 RepID=A0A161QYM9_9BRAD|nr:hypothetical protein A4A58_15350 [Tardiphaga robiniae]